MRPIFCHFLSCDWKHSVSVAIHRAFHASSSVHNKSMFSLIQARMCLKVAVQTSNRFRSIIKIQHCQIVYQAASWQHKDQPSSKVERRKKDCFSFSTSCGSL